MNLIERSRAPWIGALLCLALASCGSEESAAAGEAAAAGSNAPLTPEQARALHDRLVTIDTHKDISSNLASQDFPADPEALERFRTRYDPTFRGSSQVDFPKMREGGLDVAFFIVYVGQGPLTEEGYARAKQTALDKFTAIHRMAEFYPDHIALALTPDDVDRATSAGKLVACIGIENGYPVGTDLALIEEFHRRGARYLSLTHNKHSQLGDSQTPGEGLYGGASPLGLKVVEELNRVGIMVDVSHAGKLTMMDAVRHSQAPVIASHSGVRALCDHGRNLDDEQLLALKENGGVIQVVAFSSYLRDSAERSEALSALREEVGLQRTWARGSEPTEEQRKEYDAKRAIYDLRRQDIDELYPPSNVQDLADHIDHAVSLIGIDHVGISSDFDGGGGISGWSNASETFNVTQELLQRGYKEEDLRKLWGQNLLRVWRDVERVAAQLQGA